jgi:hypothetical protein
MGYLTAIAAAVLLTVGGSFAYKYNKLSDDNAKLRKDYKEATVIIEQQSREIEAFQKAEVISKAQAEGKQNAEILSGAISTQLSGLRKSIASLQAKSANSLEACNKSSAVAGELLNHCGERYKDLGRKAELLRQDAIALDSYTNVLTGLIGGLEPLNGK